MKTCPGCGGPIVSADDSCPSCTIKEKTPFTIRQFILDNFRMFTIIGTTGTMISLIPAMGTRVLGQYWIGTDYTLLPFILSLIIFFGGLFLTICFFIVFDLVFQGRRAEGVLQRIPLARITTLAVYKGDLQRILLLFCLVPMWFGILAFFIMLMPLIPNDYSWTFAVFMFLVCIPLAAYVLIGWFVGKTVTGRSQRLSRFPRISLAAILILVVVLLLLLTSIPNYFIAPYDYSQDIRIHPAESYYSPHVSSAKGLRLDITNLTGTQTLMTRHVWSANYGYFIRVVPSTNEVTILGNPATDDRGSNIYWTWSSGDAAQGNEPVKIDLKVTKLEDGIEVANTSLNLTWFDRDIVSVQSLP